MDVEILTPTSASLWIESVSDGAPSRNEIDRLAALIGKGLLKPHLRMVVTEQHKPFGRLAARIEERCIRMWNPDFREGIGPDEMNHAMRLMIDRVTVARLQAGLSYLAIENRPGDDLKHNDLWLRALRHQGYLETCAYRVYTLPLDRERTRDSTPQGLTVGEIGRVGENALVELYRSVKAQTLEQRDADGERPTAAIEHMKRIGRGHAGATWLLACFEDVPAGYALANLADEADFDGLSAWLVDIGCAPEMRRKGIASALLSEITSRLRLLGARRLLAAIDDINLPSIHLHMKHGFLPLPDRHYVYRLR
jgi:L-amino acid N-acyltransferase YncA